MENIYIYDGSFYKLLLLINKLIENEVIPNNIYHEDYNMSLFDNVISLKIEDSTNINEFSKKIGKINFKNIFYVFLSENPNKELIIFYYIKNAIKYGDNLIYRRNLKCVRMVLKISHYVSNEAHRFKGFTRFKELDNKVLYASVNPENDILIILSKHFKLRLKGEYWIIKDIKRDKYSVYDKKNFYIVSSDEFKLLNIDISKDEELFASLWKLFYKTIAISERKNERCRMNFMPKKYWNCILEVSDEIEEGNNR